MNSNPDPIKVEALINNGWETLWHPDNWIKSGVDYPNPDWAGISTEKAYSEMIKELNAGLTQR